MVPPRQWRAIVALVLAALAQRCGALAFTTENWDLERGKTMNITWTETEGSEIGMSVYYTRTIPGRFEPRLTIECTCTRTSSLDEEAQRQHWVEWTPPKDLSDGHYMFSTWNADGADYWVEPLGDTSSGPGNDGMSSGTKAGIGVAAAVGGIGLIALVAAMLLYRRIRSISHHDHAALVTTPEPPQGPESSLGSLGGTYVDVLSRKTVQMGHNPVEVDGDYTYHEMGTPGQVTGMETSTYTDNQSTWTPSAQTAYTPQIRLTQTPDTRMHYGQGHADQAQYAQGQEEEIYPHGQSDHMQYSQDYAEKSRYSQGHVDQMRYSTGQIDQRQYTQGHMDQARYSMSHIDQTHYTQGYADQPNYPQGRTDQMHFTQGRVDQTNYSNTVDMQTSYASDSNNRYSAAPSYTSNWPSPPPQARWT